MIKLLYFTITIKYLINSHKLNNFLNISGVYQLKILNYFILRIDI